MLMKRILDTERLSLRTLTEEDTPFIVELVNTPGWLTYIGDKKIHSSQQAIQYLQEGPWKSYQNHGFGLWLVQLKNTTTSIGMCGFLKRDYLPAPDIGFAFLPAYSGKGYAFEIASAALHYAKESLEIKVIQAITLPTNERSIKLLERIGLNYSKDICAPGDLTVLKLYQKVLAK